MLFVRPKLGKVVRLVSPASTKPLLTLGCRSTNLRRHCKNVLTSIEYGGQKFSRGALYLILQNRLYRGEIPHKGNSFPGEPPAIVDKPLWDDVQAVLAANRVDRATGARASNPSLLTGMVFDETGEPLTPTYAVKKGTRYLYYVSPPLLTGAGRSHSSG